MLMLSRLKFPIEPLVEQMLDQLPAKIWTSKTSTFLDPAMGGGQFLVAIQRRLLAAGHSPENIAARIYGCEKNILRVNYAKNNKKLFTDNLFVSDGIDYDWGSMKFDVIVGNPPYQDAEGNPLYYKIHNLSVRNLLKPNGYVGFVTPDSMAVALETGNIKGRHDLAQIKLTVLNISSEIKQKYFPSIGISNFCWYIGQKNDNVLNDYKIISNDGVFVGRLNPLKPLQVNQTVNNILEKCFLHNCNYYNGSWATAGNTATPNAKGRKQVVTGIDEDGKLITYKVNYKTNHKIDGIPKVFITGFGNRAAVAYDHSLVAAVEKTVYTVPTASDRESENLVQLLDCKLKKWFTNIIGARGPYIDFLRHFRGVDLDKSWTDAELFAHFGLDQAEIDLIEKSIS
jgi:hypothetical protein